MADVGVASAEENKFELSDLDENEAEKVDSFFLFGCGCKLGPKRTSCSSHINKDLALLSRNSTFYFHNLRICLESFLFVHSIVHSRFKSLQHHYDQVGIIPRIHGNTKRLPSNTSSQEGVQQSKPHSAKQRGSTAVATSVSSSASVSSITEAARTVPTGTKR